MEAVILLASVKVNCITVTKAVRFEKSVSVKDALLHIANKCSLTIPEEGLSFLIKN